MKIISLIFIIVIGFAYCYLRLAFSIVSGLGSGMRKRNTDFIENIFQAFIIIPIILASLSIMIVAISKLFAWVNLSLWWILLIIIFDVVFTKIVLFLFRLRK
jgi:hypothetical protein